MAGKPLVSIITPSYNQATYLEETILSVLDQDYPCLEYIIIDGGSTDGSREIIQRYSHRLRHWSSQPDQGQAEAINKGLALAQGEVIGWLNSDDVYLPGAIASAVNGLLCNPEWALIHGDVVAIDGKGSTINLLHYREYVLEDLMCFNIIGQPATFFPRWAMEKAGFLDPEYHLLLDHQYWLRLAQHGGIGYIREHWAKARFHPEAKNVALASGFGREAFTILEWMRLDPLLAARFNPIKKKAMAGAYWLNGRYLSEAGAAKPAVNSFAKSIVANPSFVLKDWKRFLYTLLLLTGIARSRPRPPAVAEGATRKEFEDD